MTDRAKMHDVKSMLEQQQNKAARWDRKSGRSMVPLFKRGGSGSNHLRAANDSVSLAIQARADLERMREPRLFNDKQLDLLGIIHPRSRNKAMVDAMRQIRTRLYQLQPDSNFSVLVSSILPEGGGSYVSMNLAAAIAFDQAKTSILVEANINAPILQKLMKLLDREQTTGLLEYLDRPELGIEDIISPSGVPRMRAIPLGEPCAIASEHFSSARYKKMMVDIKDRYDNRFIIVDGPAMSDSADASVLSDICDYTVLVVPYGQVTPGALDAAVNELDERKLAGIVINKQPV